MVPDGAAFDILNITMTVAKMISSKRDILAACEKCTFQYSVLVCWRAVVYKTNIVYSSCCIQNNTKSTPK